MRRNFRGEVMLLQRARNPRSKPCSLSMGHPWLVGIRAECRVLRAQSRLVCGTRSRPSSSGYHGAATSQRDNRPSRAYGLCVSQATHNLRLASWWRYKQLTVSIAFHGPRERSYHADDARRHDLAIARLRVTLVEFGEPIRLSRTQSSSRIFSPVELLI
jgi:hypothetical protein